jgi:lysophospholipase L1-like esterase
MTFGQEISPDNPALQYRGCARVNATAERARFDRLVKEASGFRYDTSGVRIFFRTNATSVFARLCCNQLHTRRDAVNGVGVLFVNGTRCGTYNVDGKTADAVRVPVLQETIATTREIEIWLPYGESVDFAGLAVNNEARFFPPSACAWPRYVAYGDSITHGFHASDPTLTYPALLAAAKNWELINLGVGSRTASASDGQVIGSVSAGAITIAIGTNDYLGNIPRGQFKADVNGMLRNIRAAQPTTPIWLITPLWHTESWHPSRSPNGRNLRLDDYRKVLREIAVAANDPRLHLIEGTELIPADASFFTDGIHPNDKGFRCMADGVASKVSLTSP